MPSVLIDNTLFKHRLNPAELAQAVAEIANSRAAVSKLTAELVNAVGKDAAVEQHARELLLSSPQSILCSAVTANKKLKERRRVTLDHCLALPAILKLTSPINEPVIVRPRKKKSGDVRVTLEFGIKHRTAQDIVARVMGAHLRPRKFQYTYRGHCKAIADAKKLLAAGYIYAARLDIADHFGSFKLEELAPELPLPWKLVEYAVCARQMKVVLDQETGQTHAPTFPHTPMDLLNLARRGLPQGSACSPIIAAISVSRLEWTPSAEIVLLNYADDFKLLATNVKHLELGIGKLTEAVAKLPGGHFNLKLIEQGTAHKGFSFLGHHLHIVDGVLQTKVTENNVQALLSRLTTLEQKLGNAVYMLGQKNHEKGLKLLADIYASVKGWGSAFSECDDVDRYVSFSLSEIKNDCAALNITFEQLIGAVDETMGFHLESYNLDD